MKLRQPALIATAACGIAWLVRGLMGTKKYTYHALGRSLVPSAPGLTGRYVYAFWHENLLLPAALYGKYDVYVLVSQHADGQLIARAAERLGYGIVHGSTTRGGMEAMRTLLTLSQNHHLVITPDGPRGPRREVQAGLTYLASRSGLPIVPVGIGYDRPWRAKSWDRFAIPRPFHRAVLVTDSVVNVPRTADRGTLEQYRIIVQEQMNHVNAVAEQLALGKKPLAEQQAA